MKFFNVASKQRAGPIKLLCKCQFRCVQQLSALAFGRCCFACFSFVCGTDLVSDIFGEMASFLRCVHRCFPSRRRSAMCGEEFLEDAVLQWGPFAEL